MAREKLPWGISCDESEEPQTNGGPVSCQEMMHWLKEIREHLGNVTVQLDGLISKWSDICDQDKDKTSIELYHEHIWKIERMLFKFPRLGDRPTKGGS